MEDFFHGYAAEGHGGIRVELRPWRGADHDAGAEDFRTDLFDLGEEFIAFPGGVEGMAALPRGRFSRINGTLV